MQEVYETSIIYYLSYNGNVASAANMGLFFELRKKKVRKNAMIREKILKLFELRKGHPDSRADVR